MLEKTFRFGEIDLPVIYTGGLAWIHVASSCQILNISNPSLAIDRHVAPRFSRQIAVGVGMPAWFVTEPGFYQLVFSSKSPAAIDFQEWVFTEVLPSIKKDGIFFEQSRFSNEEREKLEAVISEKNSRLKRLELENQLLTEESFAIKLAFDDKIRESQLVKKQLSDEILSNHVFNSEVENIQNRNEKLKTELRILEMKLKDVEKTEKQIAIPVTTKTIVLEETIATLLSKYDLEKLNIDMNTRINYLESIIDKYRNVPLPKNYHYSELEVRKMINKYFQLEEVINLVNPNTLEETIETIVSIINR